MSPWKENLTELARRENVFCKLSGLVTEASWQSWTEADLDPYLQVVLTAFGAKRVMFGSDWPVLLLGSSYKALDGYGSARYLSPVRIRARENSGQDRRRSLRALTETVEEQDSNAAAVSAKHNCRTVIVTP
jgi:hypothetical protein